MPTVQKYQRRVDVASLPGARRTAAPTALSEGAGVEAARAQIGGAVASLGATGTAIGLQAVRQDLSARADTILKARREADQIAVLDGDNDAATQQREFLSSALAQTGKNAIGLNEKVNEFQAALAKIGTRMATPEQQLAWRKISADRLQEVALTVARHSDQEIVRYREGQYQAQKAHLLDEAQSNALDRTTVDAKLAKGEEVIRVMGGSRGKSDDEIDVEVDDFKSHVHEGVIDRLLAEKHPAEAKTYFADKQSEIAGDRVDDVKKKLDQATVAKEAQQKFDEIIAGGGSYDDWIGKARALEDPDLRDQVERYLDHEYARRKTVERDADEATSKALVNTLERSGYNMRSIVGTPAWISSSITERNQLWSYAEERARGIPTRTNYRRLFELMDMASSLDPKKQAEFSNLDLWKERPKLGDQDFEQMMALQGRARAGQQKEIQDTLTGAATERDLFNSAVRGLGINPNSTEKAVQDRLTTLRTAYYNAVLAKKADAKRSWLTQPELQDVLDGLTTSIVTQTGSWWNILPGGEPFYDRSQPGYEVTISQIPSETLNQILDSFQRTHPNEAPTDAQILLLYRQWQRAGGKK